MFVSQGIRTHDKHRISRSFLRGEDSCGGNHKRIFDCFRRDGNLDCCARTQVSAGVRPFDPDFSRCAAWIQGRAHHRNLAAEFDGAELSGDGCVVPNLQIPELADGNAGSGNNAGDIHDREQRRIRAGHLAGIQRPVGDNSVHGAVNFGILQQHFDCFLVSSGRFHLRLRRPGLSLLAGLLERFQVLAGNLILITSLNVCHLCFIQLLARDRPLVEKLLPAFIYFLRGTESFLTRLDIAFRLDDLVRQRCSSCVLVICPCLIEIPFGFERRCGEIPVFQVGKQLPFADLISAIDVKLPDWRIDLWS